MVIQAIDLVKEELPLKQGTVVLPEDAVTGLVLVDIINSFCTAGAGNLAPKEPNGQISAMIDESARLASQRIPILLTVLLALMNQIWFLAQRCYDGYLGSIKVDGLNVSVDWVKNNQIITIVVVGVGTGTCALDFVCTTLSAKNCGFLGPLEDVMVYSHACATFDVPLHIARNNNGALPHPQCITYAFTWQEKEEPR